VPGWRHLALTCWHVNQQRADEEAAKIYEEFVESFKTEEEEDNRGVKAFVRGGTVQPGSRSHEASGVQGSWPLAQDSRHTATCRK